jgi:hypothetical protein
MEDKFGPDDKLGTMELVLPGSSTQFPWGGSSLSYSNAIDGASAPVGAPLSGSTNGSFWLGCTKKGRVKGNAPHGDDGHANVYLKIQMPADSAQGLYFHCHEHCQTVRVPIRCI